MSEEIVLETPQEAPQSAPVEDEARLLGWVPEDDFKGPKEHWIDAETFVERGRTVLPIVQKNNAELKRKLLALEAKDRERDATVAEWKAFMQEAQVKEKVKYEVQIAELKAQKKQAISDGDGDAVISIDDAIDAIKEQQKAVVVEKKQEVVNGPDPAFVEWHTENSWYGVDEDKTAYANGIGPQIQKAHPHLIGKAFLDMVAARTEEKFPSNVRRPSPVESGTNAPVAKKGKYSYNNLPEEAKKAHDKFVKQKLMTSDEYLKSYFEA